MVQVFTAPAITVCAAVSIIRQTAAKLLHHAIEGWQQGEACGTLWDDAHARTGSMLPLAGINVIALEHAVAAPFATRQLADLGARVIKIERPGAGDFARGYDETVQGMSSHFAWLNRTKESLALDLKQADASEVMQRLLARADVLVQNLAPGAATRLGLSYEALQER